MVTTEEPDHLSVGDNYTMMFLWRRTNHGVDHGLVWTVDSEETEVC